MRSDWGAGVGLPGFSGTQRTPNSGARLWCPLQKRDDEGNSVVQKLRARAPLRCCGPQARHLPKSACGQRGHPTGGRSAKAKPRNRREEAPRRTLRRGLREEQHHSREHSWPRSKDFNHQSRDQCSGLFCFKVEPTLGKAVSASSLEAT